jgi:hypothetical protein
MPTLFMIICLIMVKKIRTIVKLTKLLNVHVLPSFSRPVLDPDMLVQ